MSVLPQVQLRRSWTDAVLAAVRSRFSQMGPQALSNILWALAKMNCLPDRPWLNSYFSTTLELFNVVNPTELSVVGWSVNKLKLEPNDEWLNDYFDESEAKLPRFTLQVRGRVCVALLGHIYIDLCMGQHTSGVLLCTQYE